MLDRAIVMKLRSSATGSSTATWTSREKLQQVVTARRERELKRRLLVLAEPIGAKVAIDHTGANHLRATVSRGARYVILYFALTPSDVRRRPE